jgi:hypothetical protein
MHNRLILYLGNFELKFFILGPLDFLDRTLRELQENRHSLYELTEVLCTYPETQDLRADARSISGFHFVYPRNISRSKSILTSLFQTCQ